MYSSDEGKYSVVYDTKNHIVFDSFYYFLAGAGQKKLTAAYALAESRKAPRDENMDYDWPHKRWRELWQLHFHLLFVVGLPATFVELLRQRVYADAVPYSDTHPLAALDDEQALRNPPRLVRRVADDY